MRAFATWVVAALLGGCAISWIDRAGPSVGSTAGRTVVEGRVNYIIDGASKAPYVDPAWPVPRMTLLSLADGKLLASPLVDKRDGAFRWSLVPGAYLVTRIGFGTFIDDTYLAWPGIIICVPSQDGDALYVGHLQLRGTTQARQVTLSTGSTYRSERVVYELAVVDESMPNQRKRLMQVRRDFPYGDGLAEAYRRDRKALPHAACN